MRYVLFNLETKTLKQFNAKTINKIAKYNVIDIFDKIK
jgi:hypothetical protein